MYATSAFTVFVTALGVNDTLQPGDMRDSASAVAVQLAGTGLFTATPPTTATVDPVSLGYLADYPKGADGGL